MKVFHHNDMDGHASAFLVNRNVPEAKDFKDYIEFAYEDIFPLDKFEKGEDLYIVDISFSNSTYHQLKAICEKAGKVVWIDHHASSIQMHKDHYDEITSFENLECKLDTKYCATFLVHAYFNARNNPKSQFTPEWIRYVDDYDCWKKKLLNTDFFALGVMAADKEGPASFIYRSLHVENTDDHSSVKSVIGHGKIIKEYLDTRYTNDLKEGMYEATIDGHTALCINNRGNSWCFQEYFEKYDLVCLYQYDSDGKYYYSIYTDKFDKVNCSTIAQKYGGGGHPGASGFSSNTLLFKPSAELENKVFLGGTCNETTWRDTVIKNLRVPYFNPVVPDWTPEAKIKEDKEKKNSYIHLYVITPQMTGVYSIAEIIDSANNHPGKTLLCIMSNNDGEEFTEGQLKSLHAVCTMAQSAGVIIINDDLKMVANKCNALVEMHAYDN